MQSEFASLYSRNDIAYEIALRLDKKTINEARYQFNESIGDIGCFYIDNLLPSKIAEKIYNSFPNSGDMYERKSLREHKFIASQMNRYNPQLEEALYAFQEEKVITKISEICRLPDLVADEKLYAGGISLMEQGNFLNPHLDNSHDADRSLYRVLNILYYVTPNWIEVNGGHLELWPDGVKGRPMTIESRFNRLVVMTTGPGSWHSVSKVISKMARCCVSNYYFSSVPLGGSDYFRPTLFRGRPDEPVRDLMLRADNKLRQIIRFIKPGGLFTSNHIYRRNSNGKDELKKLS